MVVNMTIQKLIEYTDKIKPNAYGDDVKLHWINEAEGFIQAEIMKKSLYDIKSYTEVNNTEQLSVPEPYSCVYFYYIASMIDFANGDFDKYNNSSTAYNNALLSYSKFYIRNEK